MFACSDGGGPTPPGPTPPGPPAAIAVASGNQQQAVVGTRLEQPVVVKVTDANSRPVPSALVTFHVTSGGGSTSLGTAQTDTGGLAREFWTLGTSTSVAHTLEARIAGISTLLVASFSATPLPGPPATVTAVSGGGQSATINNAVAAPLSARVADQHGNPVPGVTVTFAVTQGGGAIAGATAVTNADGIATSGIWTMGATAGPAVVTASVPNAGSVTFSATATAAPASRIVITSQPTSAQLGVYIPAFVVQLRDAFGNPVAQAGVTISVAVSALSLTGGFSSTTSSSGAASFGNLVAGGSTGPRTFLFTPSLAGLDTVRSAPVTFTPGPPAQFEAVSGDGQADTVGASLVPPVVRTRDAWGNVSPGGTVLWRARTSNTAVGGSQSTSDANGLASPTSWTIGNPPGEARITAGDAVTFRATVLAGNPTSIASDGSHIGVVSAPVTPSPTVTVRDRWGNAVAGTTVTFSVASGGGSLGSATATTNSSGVATVNNWTLGPSAGAQTLQAAVGAASPTTITATAYNAVAAIDVAPADSNSCALDTTGAAWCWSRTSPMPAAVAGGLSFATLGHGEARDHACAITSAGAAHCWGDNSLGQLGNGTQTSSAAPVAVSGGQTYRALALGERTTCGLTTGGAIHCWGQNSSGNLGRGTITTTEPTPAAISSGDSFFAITAGDEHFCALRSADSVAVCWGRADNRATGDVGQTFCPYACSPTPATVPAQHTRAYKTITAGPLHSCGLTAAGALYCWGNERGYSLSFSSNPVPTRVLPTHTVEAIGTGFRLLCAITAPAPATVYCRGDNTYGEVGNGSSAYTDFVAVSGNPSFAMIDGADGKGCGIETSSSRLRCWGRYPGDGSTGRTFPILVPRP